MNFKLFGEPIGCSSRSSSTKLTEFGASERASRVRSGSRKLFGRVGAPRVRGASRRTNFQLAVETNGAAWRQLCFIRGRGRGRGRRRIRMARRASSPTKMLKLFAKFTQ